MTNKFYDLLGRQYEWRGEATRMQFVKTWLAGTAMSILLFPAVRLLFLEALRGLDRLRR